MSQTLWQRHAARAQELMSGNAAAGEVLQFFAVISRFQDVLWRECEASDAHATETLQAEMQPSVEMQRAVSPGDLPMRSTMLRRFRLFLTEVEKNGPPFLAESARRLRGGEEDLHSEILQSYWNGNDGTGPPPGPDDFFPRAFLQPYAARLRFRAGVPRNGPTPCLCPVCGRKPGVGVLRPRGDGGQRSLICSLCLYEWEFRRILCPACGEEDPAKLPIYTFEEVKAVRVECCDACRCYIKTVDMTKNGRAEPVVDEIAALPLDIWAQEHGYSKLRLNLMQL